MMENNSTKKRVLVKKVHEDAVVPKYARIGDAGFDLCALKDVIIAPGETATIPTGLAFGIPEGYEIQVRPRSGISSKTSLRVTLGTVDSSYRGEVGVIVDNVAQKEMTLGFDGDGIVLRVVSDDYLYTLDGRSEVDEYYHDDGTIKIRKGERIAQGVLAEVPTAIFEEVAELDATERGTGGFGSTGI